MEEGSQVSSDIDDWISQISGSEEKVSIDESLVVTISAVQMRADLKVCMECMDLFVQAKLNDAEMILDGYANKAASLYLSSGLGLLHFVKAMFTYDPEDVEKGINSLQRTLMISQMLKRAISRPCFTSRLYNILSRSAPEMPVDEYSGEKLSPEDIEFIQGHAELVEAESCLLLAVLRIFGEPDSLNYLTLLRQVWTVRRAYIFYRQNEERCFGPITQRNNACMQDPEFLAGALLGNGMINILFSIMPPSIYKVFAVIGYTGDGDLGAGQLKKCTETNSDRAPLARIFLCLYYTVMVGMFSSNKESGSMSVDGRYAALQNVLEPILKKYPNSPVFLFFQGRAQFLRHDVPAAIKAYELADLHTTESWPSFRLIVYWDLMIGHMRCLQWTESLKYASYMARKSRWSKAFCMYLEITVRAALLDSSETPEADREIMMQSIKDLPSHEKRIAGRAFPMERFAVTRCEAIIAGEYELLYPDFEMLTLWDSYSYMSATTLAKTESYILTGLQTELPLTARTILTISLAAVRRYQKQLDGPEGSLALLQSVLNNEEDLRKEAFPHLLPLAHIELAATLLSLDQKKEARLHYNLASKWKEKHYLDRTIQVRCSKLTRSFK